MFRLFFILISVAKKIIPFYYPVIFKNVFMCNLKNNSSLNMSILVCIIPWTILTKCMAILLYLSVYQAHAGLLYHLLEVLLVFYLQSYSLSPTFYVTYYLNLYIIIYIPCILSASARSDLTYILGIGRLFPKIIFFRIIICIDLYIHERKIFDLLSTDNWF